MLIVSFHTTAEAFAFEGRCKACGIAGRLATIPRSISAGCGFCWRADDKERRALESFIAEQPLDYEAIHEVTR